MTEIEIAEIERRWAVLSTDGAKTIHDLIQALRSERAALERAAEICEKYILDCPYVVLGWDQDEPKWCKETGEKYYDHKINDCSIETEQCWRRCFRRIKT